jgi:hypothetical protein
MSCSKRRVIATKPGAAAELVYLADDEKFPSVPPKGQVKVHVIATTCTYTDLLVISGNYPLNHPFPRSPGYDIVGRVDAIGEETDIPAGLQVGSMVTILAQSGGCQEFLFWPAKDVQIVPKDQEELLDPLELACLPLTAITAYQMLHRTANTHVDSLRHKEGTVRKFKSETKIFITSCTGGTGGMAVRLAVLAGIPSANIYGNCSSKNMDFAKSIGVGHVFDYTSDWMAEMRSMSNFSGVDLALDGVGQHAACNSILNAHGLYVSYGFTDKSKPGILSIPSILLALMGHSWQNTLSSCGGRKAIFYNIYDEKTAKPLHYQEDLTECIRLLREKELKVNVEKVVGLAGVPAALQSIANMTHRGKISVAVDADLEQRAREEGKIVTSNNE